MASARSCGPELHRRRSEPTLSHRLDLCAHEIRHGLRVLHRRRVLPDDRRVARRIEHANRDGPRRARDGTPHAGRRWSTIAPCGTARRQPAPCCATWRSSSRRDEVDELTDHLGHGHARVGRDLLQGRDLLPRQLDVDPSHVIMLTDLPIALQADRPRPRAPAVPIDPTVNRRSDHDGRSGLIQRVSGKRAKSVSVDTTATPWSIASAAS